MSKEIEVFQPNARPRILLTGAFIGALVGVLAARMLLQRAERKNLELQVSSTEAAKLGILVFGLLREIAQLGDGK